MDGLTRAIAANTWNNIRSEPVGEFLARTVQSFGLLREVKNAAVKQRGAMYVVLGDRDIEHLIATCLPKERTSDKLAIIVPGCAGPLVGNTGDLYVNPGPMLNALETEVGPLDVVTFPWTEMYPLGVQVQGRTPILIDPNKDAGGLAHNFIAMVTPGSFYKTTVQTGFDLFVQKLLDMGYEEFYFISHSIGKVLVKTSQVNLDGKKVISISFAPAERTGVEIVNRWAGIPEPDPNFNPKDITVDLRGQDDRFAGRVDGSPRVDAGAHHRQVVLRGRGVGERKLGTQHTSIMSDPRAIEFAMESVREHMIK